MKLKIQLLLLLYIIAIPLHAQKKQSPLFNWGDPAPPLQVREWIKGAPIQNFENGKVYVVEFWATWCRPCMAAFPRLSALAHKYKHKITVVAIDVYEQKATPIAHVKSLVDSMGNRMDFSVAAADTNFTVHDWLEAWGEKDEGIPRTFVVNTQGRIAWIGHPKDLHEVLPKILKNTWNIKDASEKVISKRNLDTYLYRLDSEAGKKSHRFAGDYYTLDDLGKPDSALFVINELVAREPKMKYAPVVAAFTFTALLKTNPKKAYEYGKEVMMTPTYGGAPAYSSIIGSVKDCAYKLNIPAEIYGLGAEAYRAEIAQSPYPELFDDPEVYNKMANWYWLAGNKSKAIKARRKAKKLAKQIKINSVRSGL